MLLRKLVFISLISPITLISQVKMPAFLPRVISHKGDILFSQINSSVTPTPFLEIKDLHPTFKMAGQVLAKNSKGLFLTNIGTGRVYEWVGNEIKGDWKRIDSTIYSGYNFWSFFFPLDSNLYSFGGIGFWSSNGNLRKYNPKSREWNAEFLNKSTPWHRELESGFLYVDPINKSLYFNGTGKTSDLSLTNTTDSSTLNKIFKIDLKNQQLYTEGRTDVNKLGHLGQTPWGVLTSFRTIKDPVKNRIYNLSDSVQDNLYTSLGRADRNIYYLLSFWMDSSLYFVKSNGEYDSVIIRQRDLILSPNKFYTPLVSENDPNDTNKSGILYLLGISAIIVTGLVLYRKQKNSPPPRAIQKRKLSFIEKDSLNDPTELTEIEKSLLSLIYQRSNNDEMMQIPEINTVLGTTNKTIEIQKRLRSDTINSINQKLSIRFKITTEVIQRKRTDFDARSFEYFINKKHSELVDKLLFS